MIKIPIAVVSRLYNAPHDPRLMERTARACGCTVRDVDLALNDYDAQLRTFQPTTPWGFILEMATVGVLGNGCRRALRAKGVE